LVATSVNRSGNIPAISAAEIDPQLLEDIDVVINGGASEIGIASTVIDCSEPTFKLLRPGSISLEEINECIAEGFT
ncbi:MAG: L-threonylcarbamoyladenylate synthase, partial [Burkholderiales bacterium]